jgi:hypothetical protein
MPLVRVFEEREYWPEFGTFLIRDVPRPDRAGPPVGALLAEYAVDTQPCGSIARAGDGWLDGVAADSRHVVRIEAHDAPPDADLAGWPDVVELPLATSGVVGLALVTGGRAGGSVELGPPGLYRVRFARRTVEEGANPEGWPCEYLLSSWPVRAPAEPPRWVRRGRPLVDEAAGERNAFDGTYRRAVSDVATLVSWAAEGATPVTLRWLADRLLTTTATVRQIIERPIAAGVLSATGDLDDADTPLTITVHPRQPARATTVGRPAVPGPQRTTPARRSSRARPPSAAARPLAKQPMVPGQDPTGAPPPGPPEQPGGR